MMEPAGQADGNVQYVHNVTISPLLPLSAVFIHRVFLKVHAFLGNMGGGEGGGGSTVDIEI